MPELAGPLISTILRRVRDPAGTAHGRDDVRDILSRVQWNVNAGLRLILDTATLATERLRQVYPVTSLLPNAIRIEAVREDGRDLNPVPFTSLMHADRSWFRRTGTRFEVYSLIGRDLLVIHPAKLEASSVEVVYTKLTNELVGELTPTELPDDATPFMLDITEVIFLTKMRKFEEASLVLERVVARTKATAGQP